jgi:Protein of unknown function (DUF2384)
MTETAVIERLAEQTDLEPEAVERVLEAAGESVREAARAKGVVYGSRGSGKTATFALALSVLLAEGRGDIEELARLLAVTAATWESQGRGLGELIDALTPEHPELPTPAAVLQARRNAEARSALFAEFGALRSAEVAELAGSRAANRAALANRWRGEQRVVAVQVGDELLYPGFQFMSDGKPHPTVASALAELRSHGHVSDWQAALWFVAANGWLGGRRPVDLLDTEPAALVDAAAHEAAERVF